MESTASDSNSIKVMTPRTVRTGRTDVSAGARLTTRRQHTATDENFLTATGKKLLDGSATSRNGESCRVVELKLNAAANAHSTAPAVAHGSEPTRRQHHQRGAATAISLHYTDSAEHGHGGSAAGTILPQLSTHR